MEKINGVSFRDYACASANIVAGMSLERVCEILGIELPVWEDTKDKWNAKMAELSMEDMQFYGEVFTNPKQGKFADVADSATGNEASEKVPDMETFTKIQAHLNVANQHGIDTVTVLENEYGLNLMEWSKASSDFSQLLRSSNDSVENYNKYLKPYTEFNEKWENHFKEKYKGQSADLGDDIDF